MLPCSKNPIREFGSIYVADVDKEVAVVKES